MNWFISLNIRIDILFDNCCGILKRIIPYRNNNDLDHKNQPINTPVTELLTKHLWNEFVIRIPANIPLYTIILMKAYNHI